MQHAQQAQTRPEQAWVEGQVLHGLGTAGEEQIQGDLWMGADPKPQGFRHREGEQEVRRGQQQARLLALQPVVRIGLAALRTMPVVAGMIAVVKGGAIRALEELPAQSRGAAGEDLFQDLLMPSGHGRAEALAVLRGQPLEQLVNR